MMFAEAEQRGMSPFSAQHALTFLVEQLDAARRGQGEEA